jgi:hypothetical protein
MVKSRLNRRIIKVKNNISGRQKLLSKLLRIKRQQKNRKIPVKKSKSKSMPQVKLVKRKKAPRKSRKKKSKSMVTSQNSVLSLKSNNIIFEDSQNNKPLRKTKNTNIRNKNSNSGYNNSQSMYSLQNNLNKNDKNKCVLKNVHEEMVEIPYEYPGDLWVHNNLEHQRDKPLEYFNDDHLKDVYSHHRKICFGN